MAVRVRLVTSAGLAGVASTAAYAFVSTVTETTVGLPWLALAWAAATMPGYLLLGLTGRSE